MGVRSTWKKAAPGNGDTPWIDGHLDKFYNSNFTRGGAGSNYQPPPATIK